MADSKVRGSSAGMTTILMIAALVLIAGLFWWLSVKAEPTQITVVEEDSASARGVDANPDASDVTLADFSTGPQGFQSLNVRLRDVPVASVLGDRAFWIQLTNNQPYLIHIGDELAASGSSVANGDTVTVSGIVHLMSDSVLNSWRAGGALTDDMQMEEARFAQSYLDARALN